jgi:acetyl esterase/lipase
MTSADLGPLSAAPAGVRISYGRDPLQFAELTLPRAPEPHPVVVNVHGGVWMAEHGLEHTRALACALAASGIAVWNLEYRRVGNAGGGWPGTFRDVSNAVDHLRELAQDRPLDLTRVCLLGHSAGGQLALWLAGRHRVPRMSDVYVENPLAVCGVVALAPASELPELHDRAIFDGIVAKLMGGSPSEVPERYAAVTPARLLPFGVPQRLIVGELDEFWGWNAPVYFKAARAAGEKDIRLDVIKGAGHFELIAPETAAWKAVSAAVHELLAAAIQTSR